MAGSFLFTLAWPQDATKAGLNWREFNARKGDFWLESARMARKAGASQTAYRALLHADKYNPPLLHVERAKICTCAATSGVP